MTVSKHFFSLWACLFLLWQGAIAQKKPNAAGKESFRIVEVKTQKDSIVSISIELFQNIKPMREDFQLFNEDGTPLQVQQASEATKDDDATAASTRLIYFLIDASMPTDGTPLKNFKSAVKTALGGLGEGDLVNVGYFGAADEATSIGRDFGANIAELGSDVETRISANTDSTAKPDAFKAMYDAIDKLRGSNKDGQRILIVISAGAKNTNPDYRTDDIVAHARKHNVTIHNVVYKITNDYAYDSYRLVSGKTDGQSTAAKTSTEIKNALNNFLEKRATAPKNTILFYNVTFASPFLDGKEHAFKLAYGGTEASGKYIAPLSGGGGGALGGVLGIFTSYTFWGLIIVLLLAGLVYWQMNEARLRRIEQEEAELQRQEELEKARQADLAKREKQQDAVIQELRGQTAKLEEQMRQKEQEMLQKQEEIKAQIKQTPTVVPPAKFDMKNTIIAGGGGAPVLKVAAGTFANNFSLNKPTITIGRAANNDIVIPEQTVSNHHAAITIENGSFFLNDLGSTNGTFVNGSRIEKQLLKPGDAIRFGAANCQFAL